ncbi:hypothetical protein EV401DRAFT_1895472 [Pisolithus croceorrhizus]|nr:hypothetical protein EV401DRAFT_1895472 [Pisolithus croceorrhizus]
MGIPASFASPFVGAFVSATLYGVTILQGRFGRGVRASARLTGLQTYMYYLHDYGDSLAIKLLVTAIWILDTLHILFMCHALYFYMVKWTCLLPVTVVLITPDNQLWSLPVCIPNFPPDAEDFPALGIGSGECDLDFCSPMLLCAPNLSPLSPSGEVGLAWVSTFRSWEVYWHSNRKAESAVPEYPNLSNRFYGATPAVAIVVLAETLITISLCILLYDRRSGSALSRTKRILNTLIIYAVNRCLLILLFAITALIMVVEGQDTWSMGLSFVVGRLYANSFLASLNSREHLRSKGSGDIEKFKDGARQVDVPEEDVIDITIYVAPEKTTRLCSEGKV